MLLFITKEVAVELFQSVIHFNKCQMSGSCGKHRASNSEQKYIETQIIPDKNRLRVEGVSWGKGVGSICSTFKNKDKFIYIKTILKIRPLFNNIHLIINLKWN